MEVNRICQEDRRAKARSNIQLYPEYIVFSDIGRPNASLKTCRMEAHIHADMIQ